MYLPAESRYASPEFYRRCGRSGLRLPLISLGLWHNFGAQDSYANARAMMCRAFDLGITHFDLANNYGPPEGSAEVTFSRVLHEDLARWWECCWRARIAGDHDESSNPGLAQPRVSFLAS